VESKQDAPEPAANAEEGLGEASDLSFEAALQRLEGVVDRLEGGDLELEAALASFEEGVRLTRRCAEELDSAERRVEVLMKEGAEWVARPFEGEGAQAAEDSGEDFEADDGDDF